MDRAKIHHIFVIARRIKVWHLVVLLIIFAFLSAFLLRQNNLTMIEKRNLVKQADEENEDTKTALLNLQHYVSDHMNTNLGSGVFLEHTYQREYEKAVQKSVNAVNPNSRFYEEVEIACRPIFQSTGSFPAYTECAREKLAVLSPSQDPLSSLKAPPIELYRYNFASPLFSFDLAGVSVLITSVMAFLLLLRLIGYLILKIILKTQSRPH